MSGPSGGGPAPFSAGPPRVRANPNAHFKPSRTQGGVKSRRTRVIASGVWPKKGKPAHAPTFTDFHEDLKLPTDAIQQITQDTKDAKVDQFGRTSSARSL